MRALAGEIGERHLLRPRALADAAAYLEHALASCGLGVASQEFRAHGQAVRNLEIELPGSDHAEEVVVLGAHYDTVPGSPGADDNGSGVAALLEIARALRSARPLRTVRCAFFVNEEPPWFQTEAMGSLRYARRARERGDRVIAMLSLESIGYYSDAAGSQQYPFPLGLGRPDRGDFLGFVANRASRRLLRRVVDSFERQRLLPAQSAVAPGWVPGVSWSDHWAFWAHGYPAVLVTDTAPFRYPAYHTEADTPERLCDEPFARATAGLGAVALALAGA